ncbi:MAG: uridine diphosphate-N-acetylglucosamine-binding protein YvcK [Clostridia bacterium]
MRAILEWLKPGARVKRYLFLQILSIGVLVFSITTLKSIFDLTPTMLIAYIALLTLSGFGIAFSFILAQKNILAISLKNISKQDKDIRVRKLLYGDPRIKKGPKIVVIGGGSGLPNLLKGLKEFTSNITAVVNVSDDDLTISSALTGEDKLTQGDLRKCVAALSTSESEIGKILTYQVDETSSQTIGNSVISALINITGSFQKATEKISEVFKIRGKILPVSTDEIVLCAGLENGEVVVGKENITESVIELKTPIKQIFLKDGTIKPLPEVIDAIKSANVVVLGPGALYTSVASNLLIEDVSKAIIRSKAKKVYISNIMNQPGQTDGYTLARYINEIERYIGRHVIDYAIANSGEITEEMIKDFNQDLSTPVKIDLENIQNRAISVVKEDLVLTAPSAIIHDSDRLAEIIMSIAKSKRIGDLNIVKIKKKHMKKEKLLILKAKIQYIIEEHKAKKAKKIKLKKQEQKEVKVTQKSKNTINKIKNKVSKE